MKVGITKEIYPGECRVAATPETARRLIEKLGFEVLVESGAGEAASFPDDAYRSSGCEVTEDASSIWSRADIVLKVRSPQEHEIQQIREGQTLVCFLAPAQHGELLDQIAAKKATALAIDTVPRISRAQKLDALSSMANIAGYRAIVEAASLFGRFFTGQITAAGKVPPARVLVIGAGVAGLAAIGTARGLGAIVRAFDVRPEVADQVKSMGADFLMLEFESDEEGGTAGGYAKTMSKEFIDAEMALFAAQAKEVDIIVTTALIPGKPAPTLITREMVESMRPGSVIVDLAAEQGGNCEVTVPNEVTKHSGVHIIGYSDLTSRLPQTSSQLYGTNLVHLLEEMGGNEKFDVDMENEVIRGATVVKNGEITWPPPPVAVSVVAKKEIAAAPAAVVAAEKKFGVFDALLIVDRGGTAGHHRSDTGPWLHHRLYRFHIGMHRRMAGDLERLGVAAHASDECHQRDQRHHRRWRHGAGRYRQRCRRAVGSAGHFRGQHQHRRRIFSNSSHVKDVP